MSHARRRRGLAALLVGVAVLATAMLWRVLPTVFFAITVAYVLYPLRQELCRRGLAARLAAGVSTLVAFLAAFVLVAPVTYVLYVRRGQVLGLFRQFPKTVPISVLEFDFVIDLTVILASIQGTVISSAVAWARAAPVIALKAFLFTFLVYALLLRPGSAGATLFRLVPSEYHGILSALHRRVRDTLYAIYVLQAATAFGTFVIAYVVFAGLGYPQAFALAVVSGVLQFIPVVGPSIVIVGIAVGDLLAGDVTAAALLLAFGLFFVGFLPDALIRTRLASMTAEMPGSLYFVGFTGGVLSLGLVGFIAGPLVVAVLVTVVKLASRNSLTVQTTLD
ncbi:AI-2E family transporter [Haloarculaceae archaeon H-GB2-1]|nr:AI-2E family transporter [Haloarculaceae archaeon H-GB1-1]MEA5388932.1 AI-2E family transporter [Haloarculaceae archaeon H-GB11]MEA5406988.1 AI-2E family transporter [Haloarculaceae archaeon H-GB2-1]